MKSKRALLVSCSVILLCMSIIVGMTYALFTDTVPVKNHLQAGKMDVTLTRTNLVTLTLDEKTGFLVKTESAEDVDFSEPADSNVFGITKDTLVVPGSKYTVEMQIANSSDVAFGYWVEIVFDDKDDLALADQIKVSVTTDKETSAYLSDGLSIGSETKPIGTLAIGGSGVFTVSVEFVDGDSNDLAAGQALDFDLVVNAVQIIEAPKS